MATVTAFIQSFADVCHIRQAAMKCAFDAYHAAGLVPVGKKGSDVHLEPEHAAAAILGLASLGLANVNEAGCAEASKKLGALVPEDGDGSSLAAFLANDIRIHAQRILLDGPVRDAENRPRVWNLTLSLDPLWGWISWSSRDEGLSTRYFVPKQVSPRLFLRRIPPAPKSYGLMRLTVVTSDVMVVASQLCADSLKDR